MDFIDDDSTVFEREPMENLARKGQLEAWKHADFWQSMDTLRDRMVLEELWTNPGTPWNLWDKSE